MTWISYGRAMRRRVALVAIALVPFGSVLAPRLAGAQAPAELVRDIAYNYIDAYNGGSHPYSIVRVGNIVYFLATTPDTGTELWRSNGSPTGTVLVKDLVPGPGSSSIYNLTNINGTLYFWNTDETAGTELWKSDGTAAGTARVKDIEPGTGSSYPSYLTNVGGTLFFVATTTNEGAELWNCLLYTSPSPRDS